MNEIIKTKFKKEAIFWLLWMLLGITVLVAFMVKVLMASAGKDLLPVIAFQLFFGSLLCLSVLVLRDFKYAIVNSKAKQLIFYSILTPFGKTIDFSHFIGLIMSPELTRYGDITTVHLVDDEMIAQCKFSETFYQNFDEIVCAMQLEEIKGYEFDIRKYLRLIFTGKLKITLNDHN